MADLPLAGRATVAASAAADMALRTFAASLVTAAVAPIAARPRLRQADVARLGFYADVAAARDADVSFPAPARPPEVELVKREPMTWRWLPGTLDLVRFRSDYVALNPEARLAYGRFRRNSVAWAQHWRHDDGARPTVIVVHGFMASPYWFNRIFFSLPWLYSNGYDILLATLPFHGRRTETWQPSGAGLFAHGVSHFIESMLHSVHDLRGWVDYLLQAGTEHVGITGLSLGGYLTALMAAVDERLWFAIPNAPVTDMPDLSDSWAPAGPVISAMFERHGVDEGAMRAAMAIHSPLHYPVRLDRDRLFIIAGLGDRLAPPDHAERLWEHWGRPRVHAFPGNHVLHIERGAYLRRVGRFIRSTGFAI